MKNLFLKEKIKTGFTLLFHLPFIILWKLRRIFLRMLGLKVKSIFPVTESPKTKSRGVRVWVESGHIGIYRGIRNSLLNHGLSILFYSPISVFTDSITEPQGHKSLPFFIKRILYWRKWLVTFFLRDELQSSVDAFALAQFGTKSFTRTFINARTAKKLGLPVVWLLVHRVDLSVTVPEIDFKSMYKEISLLLTMMKEQNMLIAASNNYDVVYFEYLTGVSIDVLPFTFTDLPHYTGKQKKFLFGTSRLGERWGCISHLVAMKQCTNALTAKKVPFGITHELYPPGIKTYTYEELCDYKAMIIIPYVIYNITKEQAFSMGIPLFIPSSHLLAEWQVTLGILFENDSTTARRNDQKFQESWNREIHKYFKLDPNIPSPWDHKSIEAQKYWIEKSNMYQWRGVYYFESPEDLAEKLSTITTKELEAMSQEQIAHAQEITEAAEKKWEHIATHFLARDKQSTKSK